MDNLSRYAVKKKKIPCFHLTKLCHIVKKTGKIVPMYTLTLLSSRAWLNLMLVVANLDDTK